MHMNAACLLVVVAEAFHIPSNGMGLPNDAEHYLDLVSAILGPPLTKNVPLSTVTIFTASCSASVMELQ